MANEKFSDIPLGFQAHPQTEELMRKKDAEAVRQSVKSLILTNFYERPFKPNIGTDIQKSLFELFTPITKQRIEGAVLDVIKNYEPRAKVTQVLVEDRPDMNALTVSVAFFVKNNPDPVILDVILERVR